MRKRPVCVLCLLLVVFLCVTDWLGFSLIRGNPLPESVQTWIQKHPESTICGEVVRCQEKENVISTDLKNTYLIYNSEKISIDEVKVYLKEKVKLPVGSLVVVSGNLQEIEEARNPGEFDSKQYARCRHRYYVMKKGRIERQSQDYSKYRQFLAETQQRFAQILEKSCKGQAGAFQAIVLGDKDDLDSELKMRYQMAGIIHILAISGLHISLLGMGLYRFLKRAGLGVWPAGILALAIMLQYGMMTGAGVSTMRAVCMFLLSVGAKIAGRIYDLPTGLAAAAILILVESPAYLLDGGFLLSFGAVIGIGCVWPMIEEMLAVKKIKSSVVSSLLSSVVLQLTTLPVVLWYYGEISLIGLFLNLLVIPTVGIVLASGVFGALAGLFSIKLACLIVLPGRILLKIYELLCTLAGKFVFCTWVGGQPQIWQIVAYYVLMGAVLWICSRTISLNIEKRGGSSRICLLFVCAAVFLLGYRPREELRITCLDVGQGDGIVVEADNRWNLLIDGGSTNKSQTGQYQILPYLKSRGISHLDGIYVSHTDEDHISGVREILEYRVKGLTSLRIDHLFLPDWGYGELVDLAQKAGVDVMYLKEGDEIRYGDLQIRVLWPLDGASGTDVNEEAMVLQVQKGDFKGLFTGDIGMETEEKLLEKGYLEDVDLLKVGHHGSRYSTGEEFLEKIKPELAVISCSATNTYGHPSEETIERLTSAGAKVLITKDVGAVSVWKQGKKLFVRGYCT